MTIITRRTGLLGVAGLAAARISPALAQSSVVEITKARTDPVPIAIPNCAGTGDAGRYGQMMAQVIINNLRGSGLFRPVERAAFIQTAEAAAQAPRFQDWRVIGAQALTTGRAEIIPDGRMRLEFRLWDVLPEQ